MDKKDISNKLQYAFENLPLSKEQKYILINAIITIIETSISGVDTNIKQATSTIIGGIKIGYSQNDKNYAVQLDSNGKAFVAVPWTDNNTTYNAANTTTLGLVKQAATVEALEEADEIATVISTVNTLISNLKTAGVVANS